MLVPSTQSPQAHREALSVWSWASSPGPSLRPEVQGGGHPTAVCQTAADHCDWPVQVNPPRLERPDRSAVWALHARQSERNQNFNPPVEVWSFEDGLQNLHICLLDKTHKTVFFTWNGESCIIQGLTSCLLCTCLKASHGFTKLFHIFFYFLLSSMMKIHSYRFLVTAVWFDGNLCSKHWIYLQILKQDVYLPKLL